MVFEPALEMSEQKIRSAAVGDGLVKGLALGYRVIIVRHHFPPLVIKDQATEFGDVVLKAQKPRDLPELVIVAARDQDDIDAGFDQVKKRASGLETVFFIRGHKDRALRSQQGVIEIGVDNRDFCQALAQVRQLAGNESAAHLDL